MLISIIINDDETLLELMKYAINQGFETTETTSSHCNNNNADNINTNGGSVVAMTTLYNMPWLYCQIALCTHSSISIRNYLALFILLNL